ncbi:MAG TPA: substrate-binding domain-containing protein [Candidatus Acidoferrales bacterium]|nr:substrate-binding domain-containing protein [Candidatus Acidoferrales bacterium]
MVKLLVSLFPVALVLPLLDCGGSPHSVDEKYVLIATNIKVPYWQKALDGVNSAAKQLQVRAELVGPETFDPKAQHDQFADLLKQKPTGILVSVSDPTLIQPDIDAAIAQGLPVITIDSDAPASKRLTFIGTDNYKAGVMAATVAAARLHGKGEVIVFTMPEQSNLKDRLRGYRDTFAGYPQIKIAEIVDIKGDARIAFDKTENLLEHNAKVDAFVCLEAIACAEVAEVLGRKNVSGKVVVAMDTDERTLAGIQKGVITATVAQKPFTMAYLGIKALDDLHHHPLPSLQTNWSQDSSSPVPAFVDTGATLIDAANVDAFIHAPKPAASK